MPHLGYLFILFWGDISLIFWIHPASLGNKNGCAQAAVLAQSMFAILWFGGDDVPDVCDKSGAVNLADLSLDLGFVLGAVPVVNRIVPGHSHRDEVGIGVLRAKVIHCLCRILICVGF